MSFLSNLFLTCVLTFLLQLAFVECVGPPRDNGCLKASMACMKIQRSCVKAADQKRNRRKSSEELSDTIAALKNYSFDQTQKLVMHYESSPLDAVKRAKNVLTNADCQIFKEHCVAVWKYCRSTPKCWDENRCCQTWAKRRQCVKNAAYMRINCKQTCKFCLPHDQFWADQKTVRCQNSHDRCLFWAFSGFCESEKHGEWMKNNCRASCDVCHMFTDDVLYDTCNKAKRRNRNTSKSDESDSKE